MFRHLIFIFSIIIANSSVYCADLDGDMNKCLSIAANDVRLDCYDNLAKSISVPVAGLDSSRGKWVHRVERDPMTDFEVSSWRLPAEGDVPGLGGSGVRPILVVQCNNNETELYVDWRRFIAGGGVNGDVTITYRVDSHPANKTVWGLSTNREGTFSRNAILSTRVMMSGKNLLISTVPYGDNPISVNFNIDGINQALADVAKRCGWQF